MGGWGVNKATLPQVCCVNGGSWRAGHIGCDRLTGLRTAYFICFSRARQSVKRPDRRRGGGRKEEGGRNGARGETRKVTAEKGDETGSEGGREMSEEIWRKRGGGRHLQNCLGMYESNFP